MELERLKYPIGKFIKPDVISSNQVNEWIMEIELFPSRLSELVKDLTAQELHWQYRPDGWAIQKVVHHCADSHMNSFIRFKLSLTENTPTIKPYFEDKWAELPDTTEAPILESIQILYGLHSRWVLLLKSLTQDDLKKAFIHPEHGRRITVAENIGIYAWHSNHHLAHIKQALQYKGKF